MMQVVKIKTTDIKSYNNNFFAIVNLKYDGIYDGIADCCH